VQWKCGDGGSIQGSTPTVLSVWIGMWVEIQQLGNSAKLRGFCGETLGYLLAIVKFNAETRPRMTVAKSYDVDSTMQFVCPETKYNRRYVTPGAEINTGIFAPRDVHVNDVRPTKDECKLDVTGFELFQHESKVYLI
jgi:hypothetical protein